MEEVTLEQVPRKIRDLYEKAMSALERGNAGYALDMLKQVHRHGAPLPAGAQEPAHRPGQGGCWPPSPRP